jgi:hypothetical protein
MASGRRGSHEEEPINEEQMVKILREADSTPVSEVAKKHGISLHATIPIPDRELDELKTERNAHRQL